MAHTDRLGLPLLAAGQAQKELTHNEALSLIDMAVALTVESAGIAMPPASPQAGQCWIVASGGTGEWAGRDGAIAGWTVNGWRFLAPANGWRCWAVDRGHMLHFEGQGWIDGQMRADGFHVGSKRVVGARRPAIANPAGGLIQDNEARSTIGALLAAMRGHGLIEP